MSIEERILQATNEKDSKVLSSLTKDKSSRVRAKAASNVCTSEEDLIKLSYSKVTKIRRCVATNCNTPIYETNHLINDEDWIVRALFFLNWASRVQEEKEYFDLD